MLRFARATEDGAVFQRVPSADNESASSPNYAFWSPFTLQFLTRSTETRYLNETYPTFLQHDLGTHFFGCFPGPFFVYNLYRVLPLWFSLLWLFLSLIYAPINIYFRCYHMNFYARARLFSVVFIRFVIPFCFLGFGIYDSPPIAKLSAIVMTICTKSPVSNMMFSSTNLRLMFTQHLLLHTVALCVALLWIPGFCRTCTAEPAVLDKFNEMGYGIDWLFTYGLLNRVPDPKQYPCWMISSLVIGVFGYIVPTFIVFVAEVSSRSMFLQTRISEQYQQALQKFKWDAFRVGGVACVTSCIGVWFVLSAIRDAMEDSPSL